MTKIKPKTLPGFMELLPQDQILFNKIKDKIKFNFELYGYAPLDTPIIEAAEILLAKTGGETAKQIYSFTKGDTDLALRFDLTVPLAKYVAMYQDKLTFPFKRYQIGKVYRGEKPQKGRFREFYQCDIDIIGKGSLDSYYDAEIVATINSTFQALNIGDILIKVNNRKVLLGLLQSFGVEDKNDQILRLIDKLEKVGVEKTARDLEEQGIDAGDVSKLMDFMKIKDTPNKIIDNLKELQINNPLFEEGLSELENVAKYIEQLGVPSEVWAIDLSIARGLDYYTGTVYEAVLTKYPAIGAICSGGRYDDLAEYYTETKLPGVGVSIGLTRLFSQLLDAEIVKGYKNSLAKVLVVPMDDDYDLAFDTVTKIRNAEIPSQIYFSKDTSFRKKLTYANDIGVEWAIIIGDDERKSEKLTLKNMATGDQSLVTLEEIIQTVNST